MVPQLEGPSAAPVPPRQVGAGLWGKQGSWRGAELGGLLPGTGRAITGLGYSGRVKRKWNEEKTEFMDKTQQYNNKKEVRC